MTPQSNNVKWKDATNPQKVAVIIGANSMDGRTLARFLLRKPEYHIVLTHRRNSLFSVQNWADVTQVKPEDMSRLTFINCDIIDASSIEAAFSKVALQFNKIDEVYILAAMSHVGLSFSMPDYAVMANGQGVFNILNTIVKLGLWPNTRVYEALTSELVPIEEGGTFNENTPFRPRSPYAIGKQLAASWVRLYRERTDTPVFAVGGILCNHSNYFRSDDFFIMKVCKGAAEIALGQRKELQLGNLNFYRDEHWSDFGVEAMWKMLQLDEPTDLVIGTGTAHHGEEYLDIAFSYFNLKWRDYVVIDKSLMRPNEVPYLRADSSLARKKIGWKPDRMPFKFHVEELCRFAAAKVSGQYYPYVDMYAAFPG